MNDFDSAPSRAVPQKEEILGQLTRILEGSTLRKSEVLRNILIFLANSAAQDPDYRLKEHEIATRALGRTDNFDSRLDSAVRVHIARLRIKLTEYYAGEGANDPVIFDIPKGAYQLTFSYLFTETAAPPAPVEPAIVETVSPPPRPVSPVWKAGWIVAALLAVVSLVFWAQRAGAAPPRALAAFWADFAASDRQTMLFFPSFGYSQIAGDGPCYTRTAPANPGTLAAPSTPELYAGLGEVYASGELANLFGRYWKPLSIRRNRAFSWDDSRGQNLILLGGICVNPQMRELPPLRRYRFGINRTNPAAGAYIEDLHPSPGQPESYDHAIVAMIRFGNNQRFLLLAGSTTLGTLGAVDFVSQEDTVNTLLGVLSKQHRGRSGGLPDFEALLRITVRDNVPVQSQIVGTEVWDD